MKIRLLRLVVIASLIVTGVVLLAVGSTLLLWAAYANGALAIAAGRLVQASRGRK